MHDQNILHASQIASAYLSANRMRAVDVPSLVLVVFDALTALGQTKAPEPARKLGPAQVRRSISPDHLVSFVDGKSYRSLKRHLNSHDLTPETYREKYGLPVDYPMVAESYAKARSEHAYRIGLGRRAKQKPRAASRRG